MPAEPQNEIGPNEDDLLLSIRGNERASIFNRPGQQAMTPDVDKVVVNSEKTNFLSSLLCIQVELLGVLSRLSDAFTHQLRDGKVKTIAGGVRREE